MEFDCKEAAQAILGGEVVKKIKCASRRRDFILSGKPILKSITSNRQKLLLLQKATAKKRKILIVPLIKQTIAISNKIKSISNN